MIKFKVNNEIIKFGKGNTVSDFYYYLLLSDFNYLQIEKTIIENKWWFEKFDDNAKKQILDKIRELKMANE